jgi:hypothetical protein
MKKPSKKPATIPVRVRFGQPRIYVGPGLYGKYYGKSVWDIWPTLNDANHPTLGGDGLFVEPATITVLTAQRFSTPAAAMRAALALAKRQPVVVTEKPNA